MNPEDLTPEEAAEHIATVLRKPGRAGYPTLSHTRALTQGGFTALLVHDYGAWSISANTYRALVHEVAKDAFSLWPSDDERADHDAHAAKLRQWAREAMVTRAEASCPACEGGIGSLCETCTQLASEGRL